MLMSVADESEPGSAGYVEVVVVDEDVVVVEPPDLVAACAAEAVRPERRTCVRRPAAPAAFPPPRVTGRTTGVVVGGVVVGGTLEGHIALNDDVVRGAGSLGRPVPGFWNRHPSTSPGVTVPNAPVLA